MKTQKIQEYRPATKEILFALESEYQWLDLLKSRGKPYDSLIELIQEYGAKSDSSISVTLSIKSIAERINRKAIEVTKWLNEMYKELFDLNETSPELFASAEGFPCEFIFTEALNKHSVCFTLWMQTKLAAGEHFVWTFINPKLGTGIYYVDTVEHSHENGKHLQTYYLKSGYFKPYRKYLLDKGLFLDLISLHELIEFPEYHIDDLLIYRVEQNRDGYPESFDYLLKRKNQRH